MNIAVIKGDIARVRANLDQERTETSVIYQKRDISMCTPLGLAAEYNHVEIAKLLLDYGEPVDEKDKHGWTPLAHATFRGHAEMTELLCKYGAEFKMGPTSHGKSVLTWAALLGHKTTVEVLHQYGAT